MMNPCKFDIVYSIGNKAMDALEFGTKCRCCHGWRLIIALLLGGLCLLLK